MVLPMADHRLDAPIFNLWTDANINASQTLTSDAVDLRGWGLAAIFAVCTQNISRSLELSDDGTNWYAFAAGGVNASVTATINANTPTVVFVVLAGARFLRLKVQNTGAAAGALTARVGLGRYG